MLANGCNLAGDVPTLAYRIEDRGDGPAVEWEAEPVDVTAEQALAAESEDPHERDERAECDRWLRETLSDGPVPVAGITKAARGAGVSPSALNGSKRRIGARTERYGFGKGSKCSWALAPDASIRDPESPIDFT